MQVDRQDSTGSGRRVVVRDAVVVVHGDGETSSVDIDVRQQPFDPTLSEHLAPPVVGKASSILVQHAWTDELEARTEDRRKRYISRRFFSRTTGLGLPRKSRQSP
jgi:hypothetical protein